MLSRTGNRHNLLAGAAAAVLCLLAAAPSAGAQSAPVMPGTEYVGALTAPHQVSRYQLTAPETAVLRIHVAHTNRSCEVWATLTDGTAGSVVQNFVPDGGVDIEALVVESGNYELAIDSGPIRACTGATYSFSAEFISLHPAPPRSAPTRGAANTCDSFCQNLECLYYCQKIATLNTLIRKAHHKIATTRGATRAAALRQLHRMKRARDRALRAQRTHCHR